MSRNSLIGESIFTFVCHLHFWFRCFISHVSGFGDKGNSES
ncbi:hypothetical protein Gotur_016955 [Gossypium turneri]